MAVSDRLGFRMHLMHAGSARGPTAPHAGELIDLWKLDK